MPSPNDSHTNDLDQPRSDAESREERGGLSQVRAEEHTSPRVRRLPGSREEEAWLSDEQLQKCEPAELDTFGAPVPTRMVSSG